MQDLHMVSEAAFSQADDRAASLTLQRCRQMQQGQRGMQSIAELLCSQSSLQQSYPQGNLWEAASKPFVPLPLAALQPKIKVGLLCCASTLHMPAGSMSINCHGCWNPSACCSKGWLV